MPNRLMGAILGAFLMHALPCEAKSWLVNPDQTGDAPTIQAAIDSATAGDEVVLAAGTYTGTNQGTPDYSWMARLKAGVSLRGEEGTVTAVLKADFRVSCIWGYDVGEVRIANLTLTGGAAGGATAIHLEGASSPTIENCVIADNSGYGRSHVTATSATIRNCQFIGNFISNTAGAALSCDGCTVEDCVFRENRMEGEGSGGGGAIRCLNTEIRRCWFEANSAGDYYGAGGGAILGFALTIESCWFVGNSAGSSFSPSTGGAVRVLGTSTSTITDCVFLGNKADRGGAISGGPVTTVTVDGCTLVGNKSGKPDGVGGIALDGGGTVNGVILAYTEQGEACSGTATWSCSNLFGNVLGDELCGIDGGNNLSVDPEFCAADPETSRNVGIQSDSPCAPGQHPEGAECGLIGAGPVACDPVTVQPASWSTVKRMFR